MTKNGLGVYVFVRMRGSNSKQRKIDRRVNLHLAPEPLVCSLWSSSTFLSHNQQLKKSKLCIDSHKFCRGSPLGTRGALKSQTGGHSQGKAAPSQGIDSLDSATQRHLLLQRRNQRGGECLAAQQLCFKKLTALILILFCAEPAWQEKGRPGRRRLKCFEDEPISQRDVSSKRS